MRHPAAVPRRSSRASIAGRVLCSVVARPISRMSQIPRRAKKDEPAAAGAPHPPAGDERSEPLPQGPVRATVAACRRAATAAGALEPLGHAARTRPAREDDLPVPADTGERAHVMVFALTDCGGPAIGEVAPPAAVFGVAERRTSSAAGILTVSGHHRTERRRGCLSRSSDRRSRGRRGGLTPLPSAPGAPVRTCYAGSSLA